MHPSFHEDAMYCIRCFLKGAGQKTSLELAIAVNSVLSSLSFIGARYIIKYIMTLKVTDSFSWAILPSILAILVIIGSLSILYIKKLLAKLHLLNNKIPKARVIRGHKII